MIKKLLSSLALSVTLLPAMAQTQIQVAMPPHASTFTGNVRGYWFVAPSCFTITGAQVPTDASSGNQSIAIVRFYSTPPTFSTTTNAFTTLFLTQNNTNSGILPVNIQVEQGDIIGVLGCRATANSYGNNTGGTTIEGFPVAISRLGMQFQLPTTAPQQLWTEPTSTNISRVWLYYDSLITYNVTATPTGPNSFQFSDASDSSFTSVWDYGDGSPLDTAWNPSHTYTLGGTYNVCSYITNACGTDTVCTTVVACGADPVASFTSAVNIDSASFTDGTNNAATWSWDFGDGNFSTAQNPTHVYTASGTYTVCLVVGNPCAVNDTICQTVTICIPAAAVFTSAPQGGGTVMFTDGSTSTTNWAWTFGDGGVDSVASPTYTYASSGVYNVCLIASSACSADTLCDSVTVCIPVAANYSSTSLGGGTVQFNDSTTNATSWFWDFGDSNTSTLQNPANTYAASGTYTVCLVAGSFCSADTICTTITVCIPVAASYTSSAMGGGMFQFTDGSSNATSWTWDFGDSNTSTLQNPSNTYVNSGVYTVCLIASSFCSADTICDTVSVCAPASAGYTSLDAGNGTVQFTDGSSNATSWAWDFGDSSTDTAANPSHTYTSNGTYTVCLVASNACSSDTLCNTITVCPLLPTSAFTNSGTGLNYTFTNSAANAVSYFWTFGDATTSTTANPTHTYPNTGPYTVCLTTWNLCGDSSTTCNTINVQVIGIEQNNGGMSMLLSPNPFDDAAIFTLSFPGQSGAYTFELLDVRGALISSQAGRYNENMLIRKGDLAPGVYFYRVTNEAGQLGTGKLVIR
ncbi:MAG: hypothetical protein FD123_3715 [Bacteroidetes bacterium]|nr:MAG: hypothetical protein FD123_3715 [Bacteroidota bacterium]